MELTPDWEFVADTVMGGVSTGKITVEEVAGRRATRLTGRVSLDNNGGFVQMAFDLRRGGRAVDARGWTGLELDLHGNDQAYDLRLRTTQLLRPWQSFRTELLAPSGWSTIQVPFANLASHRTEMAFDPGQLRRIGILAIGREFDADIAVSGLRFYGAGQRFNGTKQNVGRHD